MRKKNQGTVAKSSQHNEKEEPERMHQAVKKNLRLEMVKANMN